MAPNNQMNGKKGNGEGANWATVTREDWIAALQRMIFERVLQHVIAERLGLHRITIWRYTRRYQRRMLERAGAEAAIISEKLYSYAQKDHERLGALIEGELEAHETQKRKGKWRLVPMVVNEMHKTRNQLRGSMARLTGLIGFCMSTCMQT
jgi:hypothetical protein